MSTDLYGVRVLAVAPDEARVRLRVFVVYYDTAYESHQPLPEDPSFFLRVLWDEGDTRFGGGGPIGDEISVGQICDEAWVDQQTHRFVERLEQLDSRNHPVSDFSKYADFYYERGGGWQDEDLLVQADYDVWVTDQRWLEHLDEGMSWGTTSYETKAYMPAPDDGEALPDLGMVDVSLKPFDAPAEAGTPESVAFAPDGKALLVSNQAGEVVAYDVHTLDSDAPREMWRRTTDTLFARLGVGPHASTVWLKHPWEDTSQAWEAASGDRVDFTPRTHAVSPGGSFWVDFGAGSQLDFIGDDGATDSSIDAPGTVEACGFSNDERVVAIGGMFDSVLLWDPVDECELGSIPVDDRVNGLAVSPGGEYVAVVEFHTATIYRAADGQALRRLEGRDYIGSPAWSPDGHWFGLAWSEASSGYGGGVRLFRVRAGS